MEETKNDFNFDLINRFISDYKLPIPKIFDIGQFAHYLHLCEKDYKALTKYRDLINLIDECFEGDSNKFLTEYYNKREEIIQAILTNTAYQEFNNMDMNKYSIKDFPKDVTSKNIYNCENVNRIFLSIDMKKANFQALKYVNPDIVFNKDTYEDFIDLFTDLDYIKESKYSRQVIFGKCNPKRHITVEKYLINEIRKYLETNIFNNLGLKLISLSNDEIVYECPSTYTDINFDFAVLTSSVLESIKNEIKDFIGIDISIEIFRLKGFNLFNSLSPVHMKKINTFYIKENLLNKKKELKCVPEPLFAIIYKLINNDTVLTIDKVINYEGMRATLDGNFSIKEI